MVEHKDETIIIYYYEDPHITWIHTTFDWNFNSICWRKRKVYIEILFLSPTRIQNLELEKVYARSSSGFKMYLPITIWLLKEWLSRFSGKSGVYSTNVTQSLPVELLYSFPSTSRSE